MIKKKYTIAAIFIFFGLSAYGQNLDLDSCFAMAKRQYPLIRQRGVIEKTSQYNIQNALRGYLPQFSISGQATYQSAVTTVSLPAAFKGFSFPTPNKNQFNIHGEIDQTLYDGGAIHNQRLMEEASEGLQKSSLDVNLYALRDRVNQIYFGILLINEQIKQNSLLQSDIKNSIDKTKAAVTNGIALKSNIDELEAGLMQQQQNRIGLEANRQAYIDMLGVFIGRTLDTTAILAQPAEPVISNSIKRPELNYYDAQRLTYNVQDKMLSSGVLPKFSFYVQGGYANPGLNAFDTKAEPYYIGGLRLAWNLGGLYTIKNQRKVLVLNRQLVDIQKEAFLFNTTLTLKQENTEITRLRETLIKDEEIINKRISVKNAAQAKLSNGAVTVHEYISQLDAEDQAKQSQILHKIQLLMALYNYQSTSGN